ncbi:hypothetical protein KKD19_06070 [Patescibacteria group bacterium]|nr:hypothetical protein [Patescibacteria group bacterium]MBU4512770.1 hypothetical protein [Patescibacteria group bacterium]MCG2693109.1 hypothetical protein [Candidatus Parcubacteria bacterium]
MFTEALVCALAEMRFILVGGRELDSSYDTYDTEYGWKAENYRQATGGTEFDYRTICIGVYSLKAEKFTKIVQRFRSALITHVNRLASAEELQKALEGYVTIKGRGDIVVFHRSGNRLLDIGKYGIVDTLTGETLSGLVGVNNEILGYDGSSIYFKEEHFATDLPVFQINLEEGLRTGQFKAMESSEKKKEYFKDFDKRLRRRHLAPFVVEVNGEKFTVDNQKYEDCMEVDSSSIIAPDRKVIWKAGYHRYIGAAIGFPEAVLLQKGDKT